MTIDEKKLRELAAKATPGPRVVIGCNDESDFQVRTVCRVRGSYVCVPYFAGDMDDAADAEYIAAASPDVMLAILAELSRLRSAVREYAEAVDTIRDRTQTPDTKRAHKAAEAVYALGREYVKAGRGDV